jgi:hypothetical protein
MAIPRYDALDIGGGQARRGVVHRRKHLDMASQWSIQKQTGGTILTFRRSGHFASVTDFSQYRRRFAHSQVTGDGDSIGKP